MALRTLARQWLALRDDRAGLRAQIQQMTRRANPALLQLPGIGPDTGAALLITAGDNPQRLRSSAAFAALCEVSPIQASSGKQHRHRLSRGVQRQANAALHRIVLVRTSHHDPRTAECKSKRDITRCLKRYIAREVYRVLLHPDNGIDASTLRT